MAFEMNDYERGFIAGMDYQAESSVDKAVNAISKREWVGLTEEEFDQMLAGAGFTQTDLMMIGACVDDIRQMIEAKLREKNT